MESKPIIFPRADEQGGPDADDQIDDEHGEPIADTDEQGEQGEPEQQEMMMDSQDDDEQDDDDVMDEGGESERSSHYDDLEYTVRIRRDSDTDSLAYNVLEDSDSDLQEEWAYQKQLMSEYILTDDDGEADSADYLEYARLRFGANS